MKTWYDGEFHKTRDAKLVSAETRGVDLADVNSHSDHGCVRIAEYSDNLFRRNKAKYAPTTYVDYNHRSILFPTYTLNALH